jgi:hypothetical protein
MDIPATYPDRLTLAAGRPYCGMLLFLLACDSEGEDSDSAPPERPWQALQEFMPGALLSVWGRASDDLFVVGADGGAGPEAWHLDGSRWVPLDGLDAGDLWWVHGDDAGLWTAGAGGRVFRGNPDGSGLVGEVVDPTVTFFGVWGPGDGTAWAVGGDPDAAADAAVMWRFDGAAWSEVVLPADIAATIALYKVWGAAADDVWAVGAAGKALHYDGTAWQAVETLNYGNLFTVHDGYAVGGTVQGSILRITGGGSTFTDESPEYAPQISGVYGGPEPVAVGALGSVWFRGGTGWVADERERPTYRDLHAVWRDPDGGVWCVGGHVSAAPLIQGALVYLGDAAPPPLEF